MARKQADPKSIRVRKDGRHQLLVYLDPELIKDLKRFALDEDIHVYEIVEQASRGWLAARSKSRRPRGSGKLT